MMMTEDELKIQRTKAKANLELLQMYQLAGTSTVQQVDEAKRIYQALRDYQIPAPGLAAAIDPPASAAASPVVIPAMAVSEFTQLLEDLTIQKAEAHKQMAIRSNRLADYPPETNLKALVLEIQEWKARRNELAAQIAYLKANGRLPEVEPTPVEEDAPEGPESAFLINLPQDRYELTRLLANSLAPKLSRARKGLRAAKLPLWQAHYTKQVAILEKQIELVKSQISALA